MKNIILVFVVLLLLSQSYAKSGNVFLNINNSDTLTVKTINYSDSLPDSSAYIYIDYPQILGLQNKDIEDNINSFFKSEFEQAIIWYDEIAADTSEADSNEFNFNYSFETGFEIEYNSYNFLSIKLDHYQYTGGAHGNFYSVGYNISTDNGKNLTLSDIINNDSFDLLSYECEQAILDSFQVNNLTEAGLFEDEINITPEQDFYIVPGALVLQFDPYEIGPYVMGEINVQISFNKIKDILKDNLPFTIK